MRFCFFACTKRLVEFAVFPTPATYGHHKFYTNMVENVDRGPMMVGVVWMFQCIAFALVAIRLYARLVVVQTYSWDDHCFNAAVVSLFFFQTICDRFPTSNFINEPCMTPEA